MHPAAHSLQRDGVFVQREANVVQQGTKRDAALRFFVYLAFGLFSYLRFTGWAGDDLVSSFVGCRLIASGQINHLYDFDPANFVQTASPVWHAVATAGGFPYEPHPYVQIPLWGWSLQPLCTRLDFQQFRSVFLILSILSVIGIIDIVRRVWAPRFADPRYLLPLLAALLLTAPYPYSLALGQTHPLILVLVVFAAVAAERDWWVWAGIALAAAAAVKITPVALAAFWLARGHYRAAASFAVAILAIGLANLAAVGWAPTLAFLHTMHRMSDILLLSYNNQSIAVWMVHSKNLGYEIAHFDILPLPATVKWACSLLLLAIPAAVGWSLRGVRDHGAGVALVLIALTITAPIAWLHYYIALIPAVMILAQRGEVWGWGVQFMVFELNYPVIGAAPATYQMHVPEGLFRTPLLSAMVMAIALAWMITQTRRAAAADAAQDPVT